MNLNLFAVHEGDKDLVQRVEEFLFLDADLLDSRRYSEWIELFAPDAVNFIPSLNAPDEDYTYSPYLQYDNMPRLESRVRLLSKGQIVAENPAGKTARIIGNIQAFADAEEQIGVRANFIMTHSRLGDVRIISGHLRHKLVKRGQSFLYTERCSVLSLDMVTGHFAFII